MKNILPCCGIVSVLFGVFHALFWPAMGWPSSLSYMTVEHRMLIQTFNFCMMPVFFVLAWGYLRYPKAVFCTPLGRCFSMVPVAIFGFRALAEPLFGDLHNGESWFFLLLCLLLAGLFSVPLLGKQPLCAKEREPVGS